MLETTESLLPKPGSADRALRVITAGLDDDSLDELDRLLHTLGAESVARVEMNQRKISPATYLGAGKLDEIKLEVEKREAEAVIINVELSPNQLRNVEKIIGKPIM